MNNFNKGEITLVGAGPGDPELLTIKGLNAIRNADVILYDALINPKLLEHNRHAEKVFVGKRRGFARKNQEEINQLLVEYALKEKKVVRLKGGDPLIFGRAAEELTIAQLFGIPTQVIPGISSFVGIAAQHQIPLTKRATYESVWITTGHTHDGKISSDIAIAAQSKATVVVLMGMRFLADIIAAFRRYKPADYPVAIIQNGTTAAERVIVGSLENIIEQVEEQKIGNPANIIFGHAVTDQVTQYKHLIAAQCVN
ncbi:MAG: uroporphyrinogen-III C-methyltransferase [Flavobacteriaceae bacterium]|nr:uroporphyrinogen-III C-methyltransferase [Flavobacteriaceae bacterium]